MINRAKAWLALAALAFGCSGCARSCQVDPQEPLYQPGTGGASTGGAYWETPSAGQGGGSGTQTQATGGSVPQPATCDWLPARSNRANREVKPRVVGGVPASALYPGVAALETQSGFQFCGCTLLSPDRCLTAAHCQVEPGDVVHAGTLDLRVGGIHSVVREARHHPDWHSTGSGADVAVLHLVTPIELPEYAVLPDAASHAGDVAWVVGWGATAEGSGTTPVLRHARLPVVSWAACQRVYGTLTATDMCAGGDGHDGCQGDSGGPLYAADERTVIGITSRGIGCGRLGIPGVWTSAIAVKDWVTTCSR